MEATARSHAQGGDNRETLAPDLGIRRGNSTCDPRSRGKQPGEIRMIVAGVMSGTSADGINVALVRISERGRGRPRHTLLAHAEYPFAAPVRRAILRMMNAESAQVADLARLNFLLGELYADAVANTVRQYRIKPDLVGCHGQTLYHQGTPAPFLGRKVAVTWQTGEGAVIAARLGVPVVSDFRPADMAGGRKGKPMGALLGLR